MKDKKQITRLIVIFGIGMFLTFRIYQFRFSSFMFDGIIFGVISFFGILYWIWATSKDFKHYKLTKKNRYLISPIVGVLFIGLIMGLNWKNNAELNKPTLLRAYYDGDFNGTSIDFKTDGTYIFDNHAIGFSNYVHGKYKINGQSISLDRSEIDNVIKTNQLEIKNVTKNSVNYLAGTFLFQIEPNGSVMETETKFLVVEDNR